MNDKYSNDPTEVIDPVKPERRNRRLLIFMAGLKTGEMTNFRCNNCGMIVFTYDDVIAMISLRSDTPVDLPFHEEICSRCHWVYRVV